MLDAGGMAWMYAPWALRGRCVRTHARQTAGTRDERPSHEPYEPQGRPCPMPTCAWLGPSAGDLATTAALPLDAVQCGVRLAEERIVVVCERAEGRP